MSAQLGTMKTLQFWPPASYAIIPASHVPMDPLVIPAMPQTTDRSRQLLVSVWINTTMMGEINCVPVAGIVALPVPIPPLAHPVMRRLEILPIWPIVFV